MFRRGLLQQSLIALLALLIVTPHVLLRPCCCALGNAAVTQSAEQPADTHALPPCCLKRLQAAQQAQAIARSRDDAADHLPGIHDSGRCGCRVSNQMARTNRVDFNGILLRHIIVWLQHFESDAVRITEPQILMSAVHTAFPDWGPESCARLCRWLV